MLLVQAATVSLDWSIGWVDNVTPDGFARRAIGVNGKWPVPAITANLNDTLVINVVNTLPEGTSLHSHGLFQNNTGYMDGAAGVTQCTIPPGEKLTYTIPVQQAGTYWIHGHINGQYVDGLRAPLILKNPNEGIKYDDEYVVTLSDWYHSEHRPLLDHFLSIYNPSGAEPIPDAALLNERQDATFDFVPGKTYRIRIIGMTALSAFVFWIDGHEMTLVEVDGVLVKPTVVPSLNVAAAQRYSVLVTAKNTTQFNYKMNAQFMLDMFDDPPADLVSLVTGTIVYNQTLPIFNSTDVVPTSDSFDDFGLVPLVAVDAVKPDVSLQMDVRFQLHEDGVNHGTFNNIVYKPPIVPALLTAVSMGQNALSPQRLSSTTMILETIVFPFTIAFHLHGHEFQVVGKGLAPYVANGSLDAVANPMRRDTVVVPSNSYVVIRFRADNPVQAGLAAQIVEAPEVLQQRLKVPQNILDTCAKQNIKTSGNAAGNNDLNLGEMDALVGPYPTVMTGKGIGALTATIISALAGLGIVIWFSSD
ncbi:Cupredoxin [Gorgonomyces haynaldii]|nr:Cupredoxin [Gorgonomyces haynaldii]